MLQENAIADSPPQVSALIRSWGPGGLCALVGFLSAFTLPIVGQLPVGELILMFVFPWVMIKAVHCRGWPSRIQRLGWFKLLVILVGLTALGYVVSDLYRNTPGDNLVRGWARVAFLGLDLVTIAYLIDRSWGRLQIFLLMLYIGDTVNALTGGLDEEDWWKFGIGQVVAALAFFAFAGRALVIQVVVALAMAALSFSLGARSLGGICLLTAGLFGIHYARGIWRPIALFGALGTSIALLVAADNIILAGQEHGGSNVERRSMLETAGEAFISSPLVGQGSWFTATQMLAQLEERRASLDPKFRHYSPDEARKISIHSQLLVALAEGGILGGAFFIGYGALLLKTIGTLMRHSVPFVALGMYIAFTGLWNLVMSPFSGAARVEIVLITCTCLLMIMQRQGELPGKYRE
jgi:hypothetical protein